MKPVHSILATVLMIISSSLFAQTTSQLRFTTSEDLVKAKAKYPPPTDKDKQEIRSALSASSSGYLKGDIDAILRSYSDQSIELYPNQMTNAGTGNIRNRLAGALKYGSFTKMDRTVKSIEGVGPIALVLAKTESVYKSNSDGKSYEDSQSDIFLFRKQQDGQWKILTHHWIPSNGPSAQPTDDSGSIRQLIDNWSLFIKPGEVVSADHIEKYVANYSAQAVEILPNQWSNFGRENIRLRNSGAIGVTWAQCIGYNFPVNSFATVETNGVTKRAVAWGIGDHSNYSNGSSELSQYLFPWAMILTKEKDGQWRILMYHFYLD